MNEEMTVVVNGQDRQVDGPSTVLDLLYSLDLDPRAVVVELNREIIRRPSLGSTALHDGDQVELVHFVGGG